MESRVSGHVRLPLKTAELQSARGHEVEVLVAGLQVGQEMGLPAPPGVLVRELKGRQVAHQGVGRLMTEGVSRTARLRRAASDSGYDVVHVWGAQRTLDLAAIVGWLSPGLPLVATVLAAPPSIGQSRRRLWGRVDAVVASTHYTGDVLRRSGVQVRVIRHGSTRDLLAEGNVPAHGRPLTRVLFWREMTVLNGADVALKAFRQLAPKYPDVIFTMAVRPSTVPEIALGDLPQNIEVIRPPYPSGRTLGDLMGESICVVLPFQQLSMHPQMSIVESLAAGVPVITTNIGSNPELVSQGNSGWLIRPGDVDGLISATERLLSDPDLQDRWGQHAARDQRAVSWDAYTTELLELYRHVALKRRVR